MDSRIGGNWGLKGWRLDLKLQVCAIHRRKEGSGLNVASVHAFTGQCRYLVICYNSCITSYGDPPRHRTRRHRCGLRKGPCQHRVGGHGPIRSKPLLRRLRQGCGEPTGDVDNVWLMGWASDDGLDRRLRGPQGMLCRQGRIIPGDHQTPKGRIWDQMRGTKDESGSFCARVERVKFRGCV